LLGKTLTIFAKTHFPRTISKIIEKNQNIKKKQEPLKMAIDKMQNYLHKKISMILYENLSILIMTLQCDKINRYQKVK